MKPASRDELRKPRSAPANRRPKLSNALTDQINALPKPLRSFIHDLQTRADPTGDILALHLSKVENAALRVFIEQLLQKIKRLERKK